MQDLGQSTTSPDAIDLFVHAAAGPWLPPVDDSSRTQQPQPSTSLYRVVASVAWRYGVDLAPLLQSLVTRWLAEEPARNMVSKKAGSSSNNSSSTALVPRFASTPQLLENTPFSSFSTSSASAATLPSSSNPPPASSDYFAETPAEALAAAEELILAKILFALTPPDGLPTLTQPPLVSAVALGQVQTTAGGLSSPSRRAPPKPSHAPPLSSSPSSATAAVSTCVAWQGESSSSSSSLWVAPYVAPHPCNTGTSTPLSVAIRTAGPAWLLAAAEAPLPTGEGGGAGLASALRLQARACLLLLRLLPASDLAALLASPGCRPLATPSDVHSAYLSSSHLASLVGLGVPIMAQADFASCNKAAFARGLWRDFQGAPPVLLAVARAMLDYRVADSGLWATLLTSLLAAGKGRECLQLLASLVRPGSGSGSAVDGEMSLLVDRAASSLVRAEDPEFAAAAKLTLWSPLAALHRQPSSSPSSYTPAILRALTLATRTLCAYPAPQLCDPAGFAARLADLAADMQQQQDVGAASELWALAQTAAAAHPSASVRAAAAAQLESVRAAEELMALCG